jgi:excisionase family DNA binding protein
MQSILSTGGSKAERGQSFRSRDIQRLAFTIKEAARVVGLSRSLLYIAIAQGALRARKCGARTVILEADLRRFLRGLPAFARPLSDPE